MEKGVGWFAIKLASNTRGLMQTSTPKTTNTIRRGLGPLVAIIRLDKSFITILLIQIYQPYYKQKNPLLGCVPQKCVPFLIKYDNV